MLLHITADGEASKRVTDFHVPNDAGGGALLHAASGELYLLGGEGVTAFKPNMSLDKTFGVHGTKTLSQSSVQAAIGTDGDLTLLTSGYGDGTMDRVVRLTAAGNYVSTFGKDGIARLPENSVTGAMSSFALEPDDTLLLASSHLASDSVDENYAYPVIQEIDSAGTFKQSGFNHGANERLLSSADTPAFDTNVPNGYSPLDLTLLRDGNTLASFSARGQVGDHYRLVSVLEEFSGT